MSDQTLYDGLARAIRAKETVSPASLFENDSAASRAGLAVYRNNVRSSLSTALAEIFPVIHTLVGDEFFKFAAREYFYAHPPSSPLVARYGDAFPGFLEKFEPSTSTPYLPDMARFEIAWLDAYRASDAQPQSREAILAEAGDDPSTLSLTLHPSMRLLASPYAVAAIWQRHQTKTVNDRIDISTAENILIVRPHNNVKIHVVSGPAFAAIDALTTGVSIGDAFSIACDRHEQFDPQDIFQTIFSTDIVTSTARTKQGN